MYLDIRPRQAGKCINLEEVTGKWWGACVSETS